MNLGLIVTQHNLDVLEGLLNESEAACCNLDIIQREAFRRDWKMDEPFLMVMDGAIDYAKQQLDAWAITVKTIMDGGEVDSVMADKVACQVNVE